MFVVLLYGKPAVGKYSIAQELAKLTGLPNWHNHLVLEAVQTLFPYGSHQYLVLRNKWWTDFFLAAGKTNKSFIFTLTPDITLPLILLEDLFSIPEMVYKIHLYCPDNIAIGRVDNKSRFQFPSSKLINKSLCTKLLVEEHFNVDFKFTPDIEFDTSVDSCEVIGKKNL